LTKNNHGGVIQKATPFHVRKEGGKGDKRGSAEACRDGKRRQVRVKTWPRKPGGGGGEAEGFSG